MSALLQTIGTRYTEYMIQKGRNQARQVLLSQNDTILEDLGISRGLLESGLKAWPWKTTVEQPAPELAVKRQYNWLEELRAIRELRALSNKELLDIGINRGSIVDAVKNGRPGVEVAALPAGNWSNLANQAIGTASVDLDETAANTPLPNTAAA